MWCSLGFRALIPGPSKLREVFGPFNLCALAIRACKVPSLGVQGAGFGVSGSSGLRVQGCKGYEL